MSDELVVLPDWLACLSEWLREQPELDDLLDGRVVTEMPRGSKTFPVLVINQVSDVGITGDAHWGVRALFQVDVWGGPKAVTWTIAETARALLKQRFGGFEHDMTAGAIVAGRVTAGGIRRTTEQVAVAVEAGEATTRAHPKASFDVSVVLHPGQSGS